MRPIPTRSEEVDDEDENGGAETDDSLTPEEAMAGEEKWLEVQEF